MTEKKAEAERCEDRVLVIMEGETIADTTSAVKVTEADGNSVYYVPKNDLHEIDLIKCGDFEDPEEGHAEIYTIRHGARDVENGAWSFDSPTEHFSLLEGRVAFYPDKVQEIRVSEV